MTEQQRIAIIGAGVAGLAAAWDLTRAGHTVDIYEAGERVGGLAAGFRDEGWDWTLEKFYHHWFESDHDMLGLIEELGHADKVIFKRPKTSLWDDGKIQRTEIDPLSVLMLPMSPLGKLQFMLGGAYLKLTPFWQPLERSTASQWMERWLGKEGYERFFRDMLIGKWGQYYDKVNMAWMWARIKARSPRLGTFEGGFQAFLDELGQAVRDRGASIHLSTPVEAIRKQGSQPSVIVNGETREYDTVISTISPRLMLKLAPQLQDTPYGQQMRELKSMGGLCVVFALKHKLLLDDTYWLSLPAVSHNYRENEFPFLALVEHTNFMDSTHYGGDHIVYCGDYVTPDHEYFQMSDEELVDLFLPSLQKANPNFQREWVRKWWVWKAPYAQPMPGINHSEKLPDLQTPLDGVYWASMSQIYPWDRGTNFSVRLGRHVARIILGQETSTAALGVS